MSAEPRHRQRAPLAPPDKAWVHQAVNRAKVTVTRAGRPPRTATLLAWCASGRNRGSALVQFAGTGSKLRVPQAAISLLEEPATKEPPPCPTA